MYLQVKIILFLQVQINKILELNPHKPSVLYMGHRKTVQTQIRRRRMGRLIRVSTVCSYKVLLDWNKNEKNHPTPQKFQIDTSYR